MTGDPRSICGECGHVQSWHDPDASRAMGNRDLTGDRSCYREIGGAGCRCSGFRDSGEVAMAIAGPRRAGGSALTAGLLAVVLLVMGLGLLYAFRAQSPAVAS